MARSVGVLDQSLGSIDKKRINRVHPGISDLSSVSSIQTCDLGESGDSHVLHGNDMVDARTGCFHQSHFFVRIHRGAGNCGR